MVRRHCGQKKFTVGGCKYPGAGYKRSRKFSLQLNGSMGVLLKLVLKPPLWHHLSISKNFADTSIFRLSQCQTANRS